jgi:hypothetical protein
MPDALSRRLNKEKLAILVKTKKEKLSVRMC